MGEVPLNNLDDSNREALAQHLDVEQPFLAAVVRSVVPRPDAAADIVQRVNLAIWKKAADFQPGTSFRRWALAFVRYELLAYRRTLARNREVMLTSEAESLLVSHAADSPDSEMGERQRALRDCLAGLRAEDMRLLQARYEQAETLEASAARLGRSVGGLRVSLHRLRKSLKACVEQRLGSDQRATRVRD